MLGHIPKLCQSSNTQRFTCNGSKVMYNASMIWGTIGPQRMFQSGQVYNALMYFFILGVSTPSHFQHAPNANSWSSLSLLSSSIYYTDDTLTVGFDMSTYPSSSLAQARFPLPVQVRWVEFGLSMIDADIIQQPNTPSGSLLASFLTITSGSVLLTGGSGTTVSPLSCKVSSFLTRD